MLVTTRLECQILKILPKINNILKKNNLILTGAYGFPVPVNDKELIDVTSSTFGVVKAILNS